MNRVLEGLELPQIGTGARPAVELDVLVPYERGDLVARVHQRGEVLRSDHTEVGTHLVVRVDQTMAAELAPFAVTVA